MASRRAELEQRAKERGVTLPVMHPRERHHGHGGAMRGGMREGMHADPRGQAGPVPSPAAPTAPAAPAAM
jgi:hypothetical protein